MSTFSLDDGDFERLLESMQRFGEGAAEVVNTVIHESGDEIYREIDPLIHPSGRTFRGHTSSARGAHWQRYDTSESMAITVGTVASRHYLYFPDDGSNTKRHYGNQQFMLRGAEAAAPVILEKGEQALLAEFERS